MKAEDFYRGLLTQEERSDEFTASAEHLLRLKAKGEQDELRRLEQQEEGQEKTAVIGPLTDLRLYGAPSLLGFLHGQHVGSIEAKAGEKLDDPSLAAGLVVPGYFGYRLGKGHAHADHGEKNKKVEKKAKEKTAGLSPRAKGALTTAAPIAAIGLGTGLAAHHQLKKMMGKGKKEKTAKVGRIRDVVRGALNDVRGSVEPINVLNTAGTAVGASLGSIGGAMSSDPGERLVGALKGGAKGAVGGALLGTALGAGSGALGGLSHRRSVAAGLKDRVIEGLHEAPRLYGPGGAEPALRVASFSKTAFFETLRDPASRPFALGFAAAAPVLSHLAFRGKEEHGGKSATEAKLERMIEEQKQGPETSFAQKVNNRNTELARGLAQAFREHPVQSGIASALMAAPVGIGVARALGALKKVKTAMTLSPGSIGGGLKAGLGKFMRGATPQVGMGKAMLTGSAVGAAGGALSAPPGERGDRALTGALLGAAGGAAVSKGLSAVSQAGKNLGQKALAGQTPMSRQFAAEAMGASKAAPAAAAPAAKAVPHNAPLEGGKPVQLLGGKSPFRAEAPTQFRSAGQGPAVQVNPASQGRAAFETSGDLRSQLHGAQPAAKPAATPQSAPSAAPTAAPDVAKTQFGHTPGSPGYQAARSAQDAARQEVQIANRAGYGQTRPGGAASQNAAIDARRAEVQDLAHRMGMGPQSDSQIAQAIGVSPSTGMMEARRAAANTVPGGPPPAPPRPMDTAMRRELAEAGVPGFGPAASKKVINHGADATAHTMAGPAGPATQAGAPSGPTGTQMHPTPHTKVHQPQSTQAGSPAAQPAPASNMFADESIHKVFGAPSTTPQEAQSILSRIRQQDPAAAARFEQQYGSKLMGGQLDPRVQALHHKELAQSSEAAAQKALRGGRPVPGDPAANRQSQLAATNALGKHAADRKSLGSMVKVAMVIKYIDERYGHVRLAREAR